MGVTGSPINRLTRHPNFKIKEVPDVSAGGRDIEKIIDWVLESASDLVSPPKKDGENNEFRCDDVASALRNHLKTLLYNKIRETK